MEIHSTIELMRIRQWYKNIVVFAAAVFSKKIFFAGAMPELVYAFFALCFMSSAGYIINDIHDAKSDSAHPWKKNRPLAKGSMKIWDAKMLAVACAIVSLAFGFAAGEIMLPFLLLLLISMAAYTAFLKKVLYFDAAIIGANFLLRALAGAKIAEVEPSTWFYLGLFSLAIFLAFGKRMHDAAMEWDWKGGREGAKYSLLQAKMAFDASMLAVLTVYVMFGFNSVSLNHQIVAFSIPFVVIAAYTYKKNLEKSDYDRSNPIEAVRDPVLFAAATTAGALCLLALFL